MTDDIAGLKAELQILNGRIQAERNDEVRHGLQRGRLEAERAQLLVKLMEALATPSKAVAQPLFVVPRDPAPAYAVEVNGIPVAVANPAPVAAVAEARDRKGKPDGLPTMAKMVVAALEEAARNGSSSLAAVEIADFIQQRLSPDASRPDIRSAVWRMGKKGRLGRIGERYTLPKPQSDLQRQFAGYSWEP